MALDFLLFEKRSSKGEQGRRAARRSSEGKTDDGAPGGGVPSGGVVFKKLLISSHIEWAQSALYNRNIT